MTATATSGLTSEATPTGTVNFYDGTTLLGTANVAAAATPTTTVSAATTATASLVVSSLSVGTHRLTAKYAGDAAYAASGSAAVAETIAPTASSGPDLVGTIVGGTLAATVVPGESGTVRVTITNQGNATATGVITDTLALSLDAIADAGDTTVPLTGALGRHGVRLAPGKSVTLTGSVAVPADVPLGTYLLLLTVDANDGVAQSDASDDVSASPTSYTVADEFGTVANRRNVTLDMADAAGTVGTFRLAGPGTGTVVATDEGLDLSLDGTTAASALTVATPGGATLHLHDVTADAAVGTVRAPAVAVGDAVTLAAGANSIALGDLSGAAFTAAAGVRSLSVAAWAAGSLTAPWVGTIRSAGTFGPTVALSGSAAPGGVALSTLNVGGELAGTLTVAAGSVGSVRVRSGMVGTVTVDAGPVRSVAVTGTVADGVRFVATAFPRRAVLGGAAVDPTSDAHFQLLS